MALALNKKCKEYNMRGNIADHRQSKFEWAWKYGKQSYQAHTTQADVLNKCIKITVIKHKEK